MQGSVLAALPWSKVDWRYFNNETQEVQRNPSGAVGGGMFGAQMQFQKLVVGAEFNIMQGNVQQTGLDAPQFAANFDARGKLTEVVTIGPRLGYAFNDKVMAFVTGGYANATVETAFIQRANGAVTAGSNRHHGAFYGGGLEYALTKNWSIGAEYQHLNLGNSFDISPPITNVSRYVSTSADIARARLTFKIGP